MSDELVVRGVVGSPHGVAGVIRLTPRTDYPERLLEAKQYLLRMADGTLTAYAVERVEEYRDALLVKLRGVDDRDAALVLRGAQVVVQLDELPAPEEGRYYWHQLVGLEVVTTEGQTVGRITEILNTGSNDVWVTDEGPLIPDIEDVVERVDLAAGKAYVRPLPGLLD